MKQLAGSVVAVTGADSGYGRAVSAALARAGCSVVLLGSNADTLSGFASGLERGGGTAIPIKADVQLPQDFIAAVGRVSEIFGALHGVVHLADQRAHASFPMLGEAEWMELFNCNVKSSVSIVQTLLRRLPDAWLTLIGPHLDERGLHVPAQRGALEGLTRGAAAEGLRVNLLLPGRASGGEEHDRPLAEAVLALAQPALGHLRGNVLEVPLAALPSPQFGLPEGALR